MKTTIKIEQFEIFSGSYTAEGKSVQYTNSKFFGSCGGVKIQGRLVLDNNEHVPAGVISIGDNIEVEIIKYNKGYDFVADGIFKFIAFKK